MTSSTAESYFAFFAVGAILFEKLWRSLNLDFFRLAHFDFSIFNSSLNSSEKIQRPFSFVYCALLTTWHSSVDSVDDSRYLVSHSIRILNIKVVNYKYKKNAGIALEWVSGTHRIFGQFYLALKNDS